jgi:hypothetical protein
MQLDGACYSWSLSDVNNRPSPEKRDYRNVAYYQQLDALRSLRQQVRRDLLTESGKHAATKLLRQIPSIGPIRAALLIALMQTPHRFRTKRQLWAYSGLALKTRASGEYRHWHYKGWRDPRRVLK